MALLRGIGLAVLGWALSAAPSRGQPAVHAIQDNSFLMEEAYNQEEGVVQHILTFQRFRGGPWFATITQEWPVPGQTHQLSYTIPYARTLGAGVPATGLGDIALNYRYQLAGNGETRLACAPRLSLLIPSGDFRRGLGSGGVGAQANVAVSAALSDTLVAHTNVGGTYFPSARDEKGDRAAAWGANAGQSLVWELRSDFNAMLEAVWSYMETPTGPGRARGTHAVFLSPGVRWAHNLAGRLQIVPGVAVPLGVGPSRGDRAVFLYLSFEHPMWSSRR